MSRTPILVLSERAALQERISVTCEFAGLIPSFVNNVADLEESALAFPFEILLVDLVGAHGAIDLDLSRLLDARGLTPLVFLGTGNEVVASPDAAEAMGADGWLKYPVPAEALMLKVADILALDLAPVPDTVVLEAEEEGALLPLSQEGLPEKEPALDGPRPALRAAPPSAAAPPPAPPPGASVSALKRRVDRLRRRRGGSDIGEPVGEEAEFAAVEALNAATDDAGPPTVFDNDDTGEGDAYPDELAFESEANLTVPNVSANLPATFPAEDAIIDEAEAAVGFSDEGLGPTRELRPDSSEDGVPAPPPMAFDASGFSADFSAEEDDDAWGTDFDTPTMTTASADISFEEELDAAALEAGEALSAQVSARQRDAITPLDLPDDPFSSDAAADAPPRDAPPAFELDAFGSVSAESEDAETDGGVTDGGLGAPAPVSVPSAEADIPEPPQLAAADLDAAAQAVSTQVDVTEGVLRTQMQAQIDTEVQRALRLQAEQHEAERIAREAQLFKDAERAAEERFDLELKRQLAQVRRDAEEAAQRRLSTALDEERSGAERAREDLEARLKREAAERVESEVKAARAELEARLTSAHEEQLAEQQAEAEDKRTALREEVRREAEERAKKLLESTVEAERKRGEEDVREQVTLALASFEERADEERERLERALRQDFESRLGAEASDVEKLVRDEERARADAEIAALTAAQERNQIELESQLRQEASEQLSAAVGAATDELTASHQKTLEAEVDAARQQARGEAEAERNALEARLRAEAEAEKEEALRTKLTALRDELTTEANTRLAAELEHQQARYEDAQRARESAYAEERARIEAGHEEERARLAAAHDAEHITLEEDYEAERARLAASHEAEKSRRDAAHESETEALREKVDAAKRSVEEAAARIEAERAAFAERLARAEKDAEAERAALAERVEAEATRAAGARLDESVRSVQARLRVVADEQLAAELQRQSALHQEEIRALTERVRAETEASVQASFEHRLQRFEDDAVRAAEERARHNLDERVRDVERREQLAKARLSFQSGTLGAVVPGDADEVEKDALGRVPWRADGLLPVGHTAFLPSEDRQLTPMDPDRIEPMAPLDGTFMNGELPALLWSAHYLSVTGKLEFTHRDGRSRLLYLESGEPLGFDSELARDRPEHTLLNAGLISAQKHAELVAGPLLSARRMCAQLVSDEVLKTSELFAAVRGILTEQILSLLEWGAGSYRYFEERAHASDRVRLEHRFDAVLADGIRRKFDEERLWRILGGPATILAPDRRALRLPPLPPAEKAALQYFDGTRPLEDVILSVGASTDTVLRAALIAVSSGVASVIARGMPLREEDQKARHERDISIDTKRIEEKIRIARDGDYFQFLGVRADATSVEIQRAAAIIVRRYAPDSFSPPIFERWRDTLREICEVAREAESVLCDSRLRAAYERRRQSAVKAVAARRRSVS